MGVEARILQKLRTSGMWLTVREMDMLGSAQTSISARLRELARTGQVFGRKRSNSKEKEWAYHIDAVNQALA